MLALPRVRPTSLFLARLPMRFGSPEATALASAEKRASRKRKLTMLTEGRLLLGCHQALLVYSPGGTGQATDMGLGALGGVC